MSGVITNGCFEAVTAFTPITSITGEDADDIFDKVAHGLLDNQAVMITSLTGGSGLSINTTYYVVNKATDTFQLSATRGGSALDFGSDITDATVVRVGAGVPTGWTVSKAGSSEVLSGKDATLKPAPLPIKNYMDLSVDATPSAVSATQEITLQESARYNLDFYYRWGHDNPAADPAGHYCDVMLKVKDQSLWLKADGTWAGTEQKLPCVLAEGVGRFTLRFNAHPSYDTYELVFDEGDMQGATVYNEHAYITDVKVDAVVDTDSDKRPENNDEVRDALPENS